MAFQSLEQGILEEFAAAQFSHSNWVNDKIEEWSANKIDRDANHDRNQLLHRETTRRWMAKPEVKTRRLAAKRTPEYRAQERQRYAERIANDPVFREKQRAKSEAARLRRKNNASC